ncbi:S1 family peptidase [Janthinobacterium agaricidamnosum]|uniref:Trypsin family protein n=1 Tax=Janthinobacterium agaricidamnosum NBRC 102515 = DSM 9628 TaxID=1349767 RepID=W0V5U6_9BURK|nr:serine protease [Janthinobacterium agaricidamnosum]CDG83261.1 trypsin family protein [Janthinobacterium agaricidamnosum NBRC 102515 = DSM 9628]
MKTVLSCAIMLCLLSTGRAEPLAQVVNAIKPSIVGIGSYQKTRSPAITFIGTGFVVGDGLSVVTAAHVIQSLLTAGSQETIGILTGRGDNAQFRPGAVVALDQEHDLAQVRLTGSALPALKLGDSASVAEGQAMAFTGFPLGMILGLHHVTHRATVSAITPVIMPSLSAQKLDAKRLGQLQKPLYNVFQLDGTAYPGSSGSPLYDPETGLVYGVVNMVYVKGYKEAALTAPSGIAYAIPGNYIRNLLLKQ